MIVIKYPYTYANMHKFMGVHAQTYDCTFRHIRIYKYTYTHVIHTQPNNTHTDIFNSKKHTQTQTKTDIYIHKHKQTYTHT